MPKCPKCYKEVEDLMMSSPAMVQSVVWGDGFEQLDRDSWYAFSDEEIEQQGMKVAMYCPECGETLFDNKQEAIAWLNGKQTQRP